MSASSATPSPPDATETFNPAQDHTGQLPHELWTDIFSRLMYKECVRASHVCARWRAIALDAPSLWRVLKVRGLGAPTVAMLIELLDRSRDAPVDLRLILDSEYPIPLVHEFDFIAPHIHHICRLDIRIRSEQRVNGLAQVLSQPAPILHTVVLSSSGPEGAIPREFPSVFLGSAAPCLTRAALLGFWVPPFCVALGNVTHFMIQSIEGFDAAVAVAPRLHTLVIDSTPRTVMNVKPTKHLHEVDHAVVGAYNFVSHWSPLARHLTVTSFSNGVCIARALGPQPLAEEAQIDDVSSSEYIVSSRARCLFARGGCPWRELVAAEAACSELAAHIGGLRRMQCTASLLQEQFWRLTTLEDLTVFINKPPLHVYNIWPIEDSEWCPVLRSVTVAHCPGVAREVVTAKGVYNMLRLIVPASALQTCHVTLSNLAWAEGEHDSDFMRKIERECGALIVNDSSVPWNFDWYINPFNSS